MGRSVTGAWNAAARGVINEAVSDGQVELWVRDATAALELTSRAGSNCATTG